jgi:hypothetical protein
MGLLDEAIREHLDLKRRRGADPSEVDRLEREALGPVRRAPHDAPEALVDEEGPVAGGYPAEEEVPYGLDEVPDWGGAPAEPAAFDRGTEPPVDTSPAGQWDEAEPATEIAPPPETEYEPDAPERTYDPPRHHEIAEEWEAHERQGLAAEAEGFEPDEPAPSPPAPIPASAEPSPPPAAGDPPGPVFGGEHQRPVAPGEYDLEQETMEHDVEAEELDHPAHPEPRAGEDVLEETPDFLQDTPDHDRLWFEQRPPRDFDFDN